MKDYIKPEVVEFKVSTEYIIAMSKIDDIEADPDSPILSREDYNSQWGNPISENTWGEVW